MFFNDQLFLSTFIIFYLIPTERFQYLNGNLHQKRFD